MTKKQMASFAAREGTALLLLMYILFHAFGGAQTPTNPGQAMFETAVLLGIYIWFQDAGTSSSAHINPTRLLFDTLISALPLLVAVFALIQHARGAEPLAEHNVRVLLLSVLFTGKDVILGLFTGMRLLFLSEDVKGTFTQQS